MFCFTMCSVVFEMNSFKNHVLNESGSGPVVDLLNIVSGSEGKHVLTNLTFFFFFP